MLSGYGVFGLGRNHPTSGGCSLTSLNAEYPGLSEMEAPLLGVLAAELKKPCPMVFFANLRRGSRGRASNTPSARRDVRHHLLQKATTA